MDSTAQSTQTTARREMMFCHECHDEWYRDEKGIICPECDSEFTEIVMFPARFVQPCIMLTFSPQIEDNNDPRDNFDHADQDDEDDLDDSLPPLEEPDPFHHPLHNHNPWSDADDPEEDDISQMRFHPTGPGRYHVHATIHRTISPGQLGTGGMNSMGAFQSLLTDLLQGAAPRQGPVGGSGADGQAESRTEDEGAPRVHRFTYSSNAHLHPRDDDHPEPRREPVDDLNKYEFQANAPEKIC